jgi:NADH-quinone oxidoreductase subunit H
MPWAFWAASLLALPLALLLLAVLALFLERKFIAIAQKRLGISFLGRNGWAHLPADLVKFWLKFTARHQSAWLAVGGGLTGVMFAYLLWSLLSVAFFLTDGGAPFVDFWDFQLPAFLAYANLSVILMFGVAAATKSKYATLAGARALLVSVFLEVFFALNFLLVYAHTGGLGFGEAASEATLLTLPTLGIWLVLYGLIEAKRAPFDHTEAESELVAGHQVEASGRTLLCLFAAEYTHAVVCVFLLLALVLGGAGCELTGGLPSLGSCDAALVEIGPLDDDDD